MATKKAKSSIPRHKRLSRSGRLDVAKDWVAKYTGKNIVRGYRKHFAVDLNCAVVELEMLGVKVDKEYKKQIKINQETQCKARRQRRLESEKHFDSNEVFSFIAGYTSGGAPYGVTWEETENQPDGGDEE